MAKTSIQLWKSSRFRTIKNHGFDPFISNSEMLKECSANE